MLAICNRSIFLLPHMTTTERVPEMLSIMSVVESRQVVPISFASKFSMLHFFLANRLKVHLCKNWRHFLSKRRNVLQKCLSMLSLRHNNFWLFVCCQNCHRFSFLSLKQAAECCQLSLALRIFHVSDYFLLSLLRVHEFRNLSIRHSNCFFFLFFFQMKPMKIWLVFMIRIKF